MTTFIENIQNEIETETDFINNDVRFSWKKKYVYVTFYYSEGTCSKPAKFIKEKVKEYLKGFQGFAHSVMRNSTFFEACS